MPFRPTLGPPAERSRSRPPVTGLVRAPRAFAAGGQAAVELVAVLPLVVALLAGLWQLAVFADTAWSASSAAHAAARAEAIGLSPGRAARAHLPARLERGLRLRASADGRVSVTVRVPSSFGLRLGTTSAVARFTPQR